MIRSTTLERIGALFFFAFGLTLYLLARGLEVPAGAGWMTDMGVWPKWIGILMIVLSMGMMIQARKLPMRRIAFLPKKCTWVLLSSIAAYNLFLPRLGYFISSILWMVVLGLAAEERSVSKLFAFGTVSAILGYLIFWKILLVPLPVGSVEMLFGIDYLIYR
jgi:hypothetical protein